jgi:hypothetical protein
MSDTTTKSIDDLMTEVRQVLQDTQVPYRYSPQDLLNFLNTGLRETYRYRPDCLIGNFTAGVLSATTMPTYYTTDLGLVPATPFPLDDKLFYAPVVFYVAGRAELSDDEFADNNRAMTLMVAFKNMLGAVGG